jgi:histidinol phosphatase-like enzyme
MQDELRAKGTHFDDVFFCPHHPDAGQGDYKVHCNRRKPRPGMLIEAINKWDIDVIKNVMTGDKMPDLDATSAAGIKYATHYTQGCLGTYVAPHVKRPLHNRRKLLFRSPMKDLKT